MRVVGLGLPTRFYRGTAESVLAFYANFAAEIASVLNRGSVLSAGRAVRALVLAFLLSRRLLLLELRGDL